MLTARANQREVEGSVGRVVGEQVGVKRTRRRVPVLVRQRRAERQLDIAGQTLALLNELDHRNLDITPAHRQLNRVDQQRTLLLNEEGHLPASLRRQGVHLDAV
ncbi:hypothetical protein D3C84_929500 [compost metagenome]